MSLALLLPQPFLHAEYFQVEVGGGAMLLIFLKKFTSYRASQSNVVYKSRLIFSHPCHEEIF